MCIFELINSQITLLNLEMTTIKFQDKSVYFSNTYTNRGIIVGCNSLILDKLSSIHCTIIAILYQS
jgi:hypothetical protein